MHDPFYLTDSGPSCMPIDCFVAVGEALATVVAWAGEDYLVLLGLGHHFDSPFAAYYRLLVHLLLSSIWINSSVASRG